MTMASMEDVDSVSWLVSRQCGICQGLAQDPITTPCCSSAARKTCADKLLENSSSCWICENQIDDKNLPINKELQEGIEPIITSLLSCCICRETCHRAVHLPCCEGGSVCRGCGIKSVTSNRSCWSCNKTNIRSEDLVTDKLLREALAFHKENDEHCPEMLNKLFKRRIAFLKEQLARKEKRDEEKNKNGEEEENLNGDEEANENGDEKEDSVEMDEVVENGKENGVEENMVEEDDEEEDEKREAKAKKSDSSSRKRAKSSSRERRREKKKKHKEEHRRDEKRKRKHRDRSRNRSRDRRSRSRDKDRRSKKDETSDKHTELIKKENGVGSLGALQKRIRDENAIVEKKVKEKIEEHISSMVAQQLRIRKGEIEREVLEKVDLARQNMEEEVKLEIDLMRKARETEEKAKMDEMEARMKEKEEALANEKKKLAEDRLAILENQMRIDKEKQKEKKKQEKKVKQEQMKILGKDKSRPKLSFSLNKN